VGISSVALDGLRSGDFSFQKAASGLAGASTGGVTDSLDLSSSAIALLSSKTSYATDLKLARTEDEMTKQTLDLLA